MDEKKTQRTLRKFDKFDILRVFILIGRKGIIKREDISSYTLIGEGSVKNILRFLSSKGLIHITKRGEKLSELGALYYKQISDILSEIKPIKHDIFKDGFEAYGAILRKYEKEKIKHLYKARDYAIRLGCWSAMVLICTSKAITIPFIRKYNFNELREEFDVKRGDLIIAVSSENRRKSEKGILSIAEYLSEDLSKIFSEISQ